MTVIKVWRGEAHESQLLQVYSGNFRLTRKQSACALLSPGLRGGKLVNCLLKLAANFVDFVTEPHAKHYVVSLSQQKKNQIEAIRGGL